MSDRPRPHSPCPFRAGLSLWSLWLLVALSLGSLLGFAPAARAGFGEISIDAVDHDSIDISWSQITPFRKYCGSSVNRHRICWKKTSLTLNHICSFHEAHTSGDDRTFTIGGLEEDENYKIRVWTRTTKANGGGRCKYREVDDRKQKTTIFSPDPRSGRIDHYVTDPDYDYVGVVTWWSHPADFETVRVCYRKTGLGTVGNAVLPGCLFAPAPFSSNTEGRGYDDEPSVGNVTNHDLAPLQDCRKYYAIAVGFPPGAPLGIPIGEIDMVTGADTGTSCKTAKSFDAYVADDLETNDSEGIAFEYLQAVGGSLATPANAVTDHDFDPGTALHAFARTSSNPYQPGEWNAEDADVLTGPDLASGIEPGNGTGMLRMNAGGGTSSQVNQIIGPIDPVSPAGDTLARWAVHVNAPSPTSVTLFMNAGSGQTSVGTLADLTSETVPFTTDGDPGTWELVEGTRSLPASTAYLELQIASNVAQIPADGLFVDFASVIVDPSGLVWELAQIDSTILADAWILAGEGQPLGDDASLFEHLLAGDSTLFHAWQDVLAVTAPALTLTSWVRDNHPVVYDGIVLDFSSQLPALTGLGLVMLVSTLLATAARQARRGRGKGR